jgi:hypothetical protein
LRNTKFGDSIDRTVSTGRSLRKTAPVVPIDKPVSGVIDVAYGLVVARAFVAASVTHVHFRPSIADDVVAQAGHSPSSPNPGLPDDPARSRYAQVREENFSDEISDGISSSVIVLYGISSWTIWSDPVTVRDIVLA